MNCQLQSWLMHGRTRQSERVDVVQNPPSSQNEPKHRLLIVDDDQDILDGAVMILESEGYIIETASSAEEALEMLRDRTFGLVLADYHLPGKSGAYLARMVREHCPSTAIVMITAHATVPSAVEALRTGADDYLTKPIKPSVLKERVNSLVSYRPGYLPNSLLRDEVSEEVVFDGMSARSVRMRSVFEKIKLAAYADTTILVTGESGTGKELVARSIHTRSQRSKGPFIAVNTGAIPRELIGSELFGHERGSFTGATERKSGKFEQAENGTLFLDEIASMDERTQVNLLRVLETFRFTRIGGNKELKANVRVVAASNRDLQEMVKTGEFREDLYYRLSVLRIDLPSLRERREDIMVLVHVFLRECCRRYRKDVRIIPPETQKALESYSWPGNVRELRNVVEQAVLLARDDKFQADLLPRTIDAGSTVTTEIHLPLGCTLRGAEREIIEKTLQANDGNKKKTAKVLGISRRSLYNKLAIYAGMDGLGGDVGVDGIDIDDLDNDDSDNDDDVILDM